jgi:hypothetical protein
MPSFALITEGITDQAILEILLEAHYGDTGQHDIDVNPLQPLRDATDEARQAQAGFGGWERVLEFCAVSERVLEALELNDYVVIQVDTDCCEHPKFGVSYRVKDVERTVAELIEAVRQEIISRLTDNVFQKNSDRIFFAIAVHSSECWLLPLYSTTAAHVKKIVACENALNSVLSRKKIRYEKDYRVYSDICSPLRKAKQRATALDKNESLKTFVDSLPKLV